MATSSEPFLGTPKNEKTISLKSFFIFLALAAVVCSVAIVSIEFFNGSNNSFLSTIKSPNICEHSADQSSCLAVVSEVTTPYSASSAKANKVEILQMILHKTSSQIQETTTLIKNVRLRINDQREQSSLDICSELLDMSRDKITDSMVALGMTLTTPSNSIYFDVHTWLSAVLTNHNTCMDELHGQAQSVMKPILKDLISKASASLALMVTITPKKLHHDDLREPLQGDFPSWVTCNADGFIAQNIRFQNTAGPEGHQAVALRVSGDKSVINRCKIDAYQDTLYAHNQRQFYKDCYITGTVDFIFGNAAVVFQKCNIVARKPMNGQQNMLTAQGKTDKNQNTGTSIQSCTISPSKDLAPVKGSFKSFLGRPWKIYSTTVYMESFIDNHIDPSGWAPWDGSLGLDTLYYGEYKNNGPGADTSKRVKWKGYHVITQASEAMKFTVSQLLNGGSWIKDAGVSFIPGLSN
ncbi:hypothetical protein HAX54_038439 [Datura stramonium]|uniref:Pectinesterase n=1 Tax=Datura stramonium TaxID=4076 RepID=A0ABS8SI72_DATST|nr:hypothetical protein [Datura stramonium]